MEKPIDLVSIAFGSAKIEPAPKDARFKDDAWRDNPIFRQRMVGIGKLSANDALRWSVTGPNLRASGVDYDVRRALPYEVYPELEFDIPTETAGDRVGPYRLLQKADDDTSAASHRGGAATLAEPVRLLAAVARHRVRAANWSAIWYLLSAFAVISYTENAVYVVFAATGSWLGAFISVTWLRRAHSSSIQTGHTPP